MSGTGRPNDKSKAEDDEELSYSIEDRSAWDGTGNKAIRKQLQKERQQALANKKTLQAWFDPKTLENLQTQIANLESFILKKKKNKSGEKYAPYIEQMKQNAAQLMSINAVILKKGPYQTNLEEFKNSAETELLLIDALNDKAIRLLCENTTGQIELLQDVSKKTLQDPEGIKLLQEIQASCDTLLSMHFKSKDRIEQEFVIKIQKEREQARLALIEKQKKSQEEKEISNKKPKVNTNEESKFSALEKELTLSQHREHVDKSGLAENYQKCLDNIHAANKNDSALISQAISSWANKAMQYQQSKSIKPSAIRAVGNIVSKFPFISSMIKHAGPEQYLAIRNHLTTILMHTQLLMKEDDPITTVKYLRQSINNLKDTYPEVTNLGRVYHQMLAITEAAEKKLEMKPDFRLQK